MKQNLLHKAAAIVIMSLLFQNVQAQLLDDGKFPNRVPMIDNIVIFNQNLTDYMVSIQPTQFSMSNITGESDNLNPNQNTAVVVENEQVLYSIISKDLLIDKTNEVDTSVDIIVDEAENTTMQSISNTHNNYFNMDMLADLVSAYPNPVQHTLTVEVRDNLSLDIRLINMMGQVVYAQSSAGMDKVQINVMDFTKGTYILDIRSDIERVSQKIQIVR